MNPKDPVVSPFRRILKLVRSERRNVTYLYVYAVFSGLINLSLPLGIQALVGLVLGGNLSSSWFILALMVTLGVLMAGITRLAQMSILEVIQRRLFVHVAMRFGRNLAASVYPEKKYPNLPELSEKFFDIITIQKSFSKLLLDFTASLLQLVFGLILLSLYHPLFIAIGAGLIIILAAVIRTTWQRGIITSRKESDFKFKTAYWLTEIASNRNIFRMQSHKQYHMKRTNAYVDGYLDGREGHFKILMSQVSLTVVLKTLLIGSLLFLGSVLLVEEQINLGQFVASEILVILLLESVEKLVLSVEHIYDAAIALEKVSYVTDQEDELPSGIRVDMTQAPDLCIYDRNLRRDVLQVKSGEKVCICGQPGSGRTRILKWFSGLADTQFEMMVSGVPLDNLNLADYGASVGLCLQSSGIFKGTLAGNITLSDEAPAERIKVLLEKLHLSDYVRQIDQGLMHVFEGTRTLPNHIQKKITLARALYHQPSLLLVDDIWTGFDRKELEDITAYLKQIPATVIVVSNLAPVAAAFDRCIEMGEQGFTDYGKVQAGAMPERLTNFMWQ
jgi:ABC-type bacteriocin/lantibiotic exporter with double-glycine peptidase domain